MSSADEWVRGYARQSQADFETFLKLQSRSDVPACHHLLFLQMACEKLVKAHLIHQGGDPAAYQTRHAYTARNLELVIRHELTIRGFKRSQAAAILGHTKRMAQEIELLAPAVKRAGQRLDNCEYPWEDANGKVHVPLDWRFIPSTLLLEPAGRTLLKLIPTAINYLLR